MSCKQNWILRIKLSMNFLHSSLRIAFIVVLIYLFKSGILWGLWKKNPVFKISPEIKIWGNSRVNNTDLIMPMILLRCVGPHSLAGTTEGPRRPLSVDQVLSRTYKEIQILVITVFFGSPCIFKLFKFKKYS